MRGAGGTPGGLGTFLVGVGMLIAGCYLLLTHVMVATTWRLFGFNAFGLSLLPLLVGIGVLFFNGRSLVGWGLTGAGAIIILAGILASLTIYFQPSSLFDTLVILVLIAGGLGVIARSFRPIQPASLDS